MHCKGGLHSTEKCIMCTNKLDLPQLQSACCCLQTCLEMSVPGADQATDQGRDPSGLSLALQTGWNRLLLTEVF